MTPEQAAEETGSTTSTRLTPGAENTGIIERQFSLDELVELSPIRSKETLAGHIKAGRLAAYDWSQRGKGPYGVTASQWQRFLDKYLLVEPSAEKATVECGVDLLPVPAANSADATSSPLQNHAERRTRKRQAVATNARALADVRASHRI